MGPNFTLPYLVPRVGGYGFAGILSPIWRLLLFWSFKVYTAGGDREARKIVDEKLYLNYGKEVQSIRE